MSGGGFPVRPGLSSFGPDLVNAAPVRDAERELDAAVFNLIRHQVAGMGLGSWRALAKVTIANPALLLSNVEAWNPRGLSSGQFAPPTPAFVSTGRMTLTYPQQVVDELGENQNIAFSWAYAFQHLDPPTTLKHYQATPVAATPYILTLTAWSAAGALENGNTCWVVAG